MNSASRKTKAASEVTRRLQSAGEKVLATLGSQHLLDRAVSDPPEVASLILSDQWLYYVGRTYDRVDKGNYFEHRETEEAIRPSDVVGIRSVLRRSQLAEMLFAVSFVAVLAFPLYASWDTSEFMTFLISLWPCLFAVPVAVWSYRRNRPGSNNMLVIEHDSGVLRALEAWFDSGELLAFREALRDAYECQQNPGAPLQTAEDESAGEALTAHPPNDLKLCPYCAEEIKTAAIFCKHCRTPLDNSPEANA